MSARSNLGWVSVQHPLVAMSSTVWIPSKGLSQGGSANQQPDCCLTTIPHFLVALIPNSPYSSMSSYFSDDSNAIFLVSKDSKWLCYSGSSIPIEKPALVPWIRSQVTLQWLQNIVDLFFDSVHLEDIAVPFKGPGRCDGANCCETENLKNSGKVTVFQSGSIAR